MTIWKSEAAWPLVERDKLFLPVFVHRIGRHLFGSAWVGDEPAVELPRIHLLHPENGFGEIHARTEARVREVSANRQREIDAAAADRRRWENQRKVARARLAASSISNDPTFLLNIAPTRSKQVDPSSDPEMQRRREMPDADFNKLIGEMRLNLAKEVQAIREEARPAIEQEWQRHAEHVRKQHDWDGITAAIGRRRQVYRTVAQSIVDRDVDAYLLKAGGIDDPFPCPSGLWRAGDMETYFEHCIIPFGQPPAGHFVLIDREGADAFVGGTTFSARGGADLADVASKPPEPESGLANDVRQTEALPPGSQKSNSLAMYLDRCEEYQRLHGRLPTAAEDQAWAESLGKRREWWRGLRAQTRDHESKKGGRFKSAGRPE